MNRFHFFVPQRPISSALLLSAAASKGWAQGFDKINTTVNGIRNLGNVFNDPRLKNYVPAEAFTHLNAVNTSGYSGLNATAKGLRDASMVYNCMDLTGDARNRAEP